MKLSRCKSGHYYDTTKHSLCPYCSIDINLESKKTLPLGNQSLDTKTLPNEEVNIETEEKTIGMYHKTIGIDPVVGWLVCIEGTDKGRDYRIRSGRNFVGRSEKMDINIAGDRSISRERHAIIIYDPKKDIFLIDPGDSREMVYLNNEGVYSATIIKSYDMIELGESKLLFIPLCGGDFKWEENQ